MLYLLHARPYPYQLPHRLIAINNVTTTCTIQSNDSTASHDITQHNTSDQTEEKHAFITQQCARLSDGIKKIDEASSQIDVLRVAVEEQRKNVLIAAENCEKMLKGIEKCE